MPDIVIEAVVVMAGFSVGVFIPVLAIIVLRKFTH